VAQIYPRALGSLSVACYDSQGYGGGILSHLHTGYAYGNLVKHTYIQLYVSMYVQGVFIISGTHAAIYYLKLKLLIMY
jgi:hypothetical protein